MYDAAIQAGSAYEALLQCAERNIEGPVIVENAGCEGHVHALFMSEDTCRVEEQLYDWFEHGITLLAVHELYD